MLKILKENTKEAGEEYKEVGFIHFAIVHVNLKQPRQAAVETKIKFSAYVAHHELHIEHTKTNLKHREKV